MPAVPDCRASGADLLVTDVAGGYARWRRALPERMSCVVPGGPASILDAVDERLARQPQRTLRRFCHGRHRVEPQAERRGGLPKHLTDEAPFDDHAASLCAWNRTLHPQSPHDRIGGQGQLVSRLSQDTLCNGITLGCSYLDPCNRCCNILRRHMVEVDRADQLLGRSH